MFIKISNKKFIAGILIGLYVLSIIPYSIASSVEKKGTIVSGIVETTKKISYQSFPKGIQDILPYRTDYSLIIIKEVDSPEKSAVIFQGDLYSPNDFIKVQDITTDL